MFRITWTVLALVSFLVCAASITLWLRSGAAPASPDRFSWLHRGLRYTAISKDGRLTIYGPPSLPPYADLGWREKLERIRNSDLQWAGSDDNSAFRNPSITVQCLLKPLHEGDTWSRNLGQYLITSPEVRTSLLLQALEDPDRYVIAHFGLLEIHDPQAIRPEYEPPGHDGSIPMRLAGLVAVLHDPHDVRVDSSDTYFADFTPTYPPGQLDVLCEQWHQRLDLPVLAIPHCALVCGTSVLPTLWIAGRLSKALRQRRRRRRGFCLHCGFDLQASRERCPECGTAITPCVI